VFDLSEHTLTQIGTWAEVAILLFMVWEKYGPSLGIGPMIRAAQGHSGFWSFLRENRTIIAAIAGLVVVIWLHWGRVAPSDLEAQRTTLIEWLKQAQQERNAARGDASNQKRALDETNSKLAETQRDLEKEKAKTIFVPSPPVSLTLSTPLPSIPAQPAEPSLGYATLYYSKSDQILRLVDKHEMSKVDIEEVKDMVSIGRYLITFVFSKENGPYNVEETRKQTFGALALDALGAPVPYRVTNNEKGIVKLEFNLSPLTSLATIDTLGMGEIVMNFTKKK
jgi:hypothetical protein